MFGGLLPAGGINENVVHRLNGRSRGNEPALLCCLAIAAQPKPGFMDQRGGLKCLSGSFVSHFGCGQPAQFFINQREQFLGGHRVAMLHALEDACDVAHAAMVLKGTQDVETRKDRKA